MESASLAGGKCEAMSGKKPCAAERHERRRRAEKQAHPEHGTGEQLLGAIAALLFPHPDQRGHERLIHRLGDEVDEQAGNERGGEKRVHGVGAAVDRGDGDLLECGDELDDEKKVGRKPQRLAEADAQVDRDRCAAIKNPGDSGARGTDVRGPVPWLLSRP
jgi:hypothetical protein